MMVKRLAGITKLSQNKPDEAVQRVAKALGEMRDAGARAIAARMFKPPAAN
jgi:predicted FMN-binding regulatory protein PaiB